MRRRAPVALAGAAVAAAAVVVLLVLLAPDRRDLGPPPRVFAFVSGLGGEELDRLRHVAHRIDVAAPNWHGVDLETGRFSGPGRDDALMRAAARHGVAVWPVVNAVGGGRFLRDPQARDRLAAQLAALPRAQGYAGLTLDVEGLTRADGRRYEELVAQVHRSLRAQDRRLAVYASRQTADGGDRSVDWRTLARHADLLLCSGYNEHHAGSAPGPITTSDGFEALLEHARATAGRKAAPIIGAFGYRWPPGGRGRLVSSTSAQELADTSGAPVSRSDGSARFRDGRDTLVFETAEGLRARLRAVREHGFRWVALFSLGREPAAFWRGLPTAREPRAADGG